MFMTAGALLLRIDSLEGFSWDFLLSSELHQLLAIAVTLPIVCGE